MGKGRVEAFSDGVIAIIITIMVLELKAPMGAHLHDLRPVLPAFAGYVLSFIYVGIYWTNHHHMLHAVRRVDGGVLWANLYLLFWMSMVPFVTAWMGENPLATAPAALYGFVLLMNAIAWVVLQLSFLRVEGPDSPLAKAVSSGFKEKISPVLYIAGILAAFVFVPVSLACYVAVALMWIIPDRRVERQLGMG
ncbi:MAG TPA: TMEM175 family protein [Caulobacteraceae bacterium]|jgi:uncharacterized membrane protein